MLALDISIHTPHAGRDWSTSKDDRVNHKFQSTRPMRGATFRTSESPVTSLFQSTRPMRGATCTSTIQRYTGSYFNPHAPCGARLTQRAPCVNCAIFQSTRPMRGATRTRLSSQPDIFYFNPHAPCGARLVGSECSQSLHCYFNPHAPCGARPLFLMALG